MPIDAYLFAPMQYLASVHGIETVDDAALKTLEYPAPWVTSWGETKRVEAAIRERNEFRETINT